MPTVLFTASAKNDIRKIAEFTFEQFGVQQVEIYQRKLFNGINALLTFRGSDKSYTSDRIQCWRVRIERHMIFFDWQENGDILIRRVLGAQMEFDQHL